VRARPRGRWAALAAIVVVVIVIVLIVFDPFGGSGKSGAAVADNATPTSLTTVKRESLSSQTQIDGTLGYGGSAKILVPSGSAPTAVQQSEQQVSGGEAQVASAQRSLASDETVLQRAQGQLAAARGKEAVDCAGEGAAEAGSSSPSSGDGGGTCASDRQTVMSGEQSITGAAEKVTADHAMLVSAQSSLARSQTALTTARSSTVSYAQNAMYTWLPSTGEVISRNHILYAIAGQPAILLYGPVVASRAFFAGMSPGPDVAELNANLQQLGYGSGLSGDDFTEATATAIRALQASHGLAQTGELPLGSVVFKSGPVRVTSITPTVGMGVQPGPAMTVSSTARQVTVKLDASEQADVKPGDRVVITLPDGQTTPGRVSYVASVAVVPASQGGEEGTPTIEVDIAPTEPRATGQLDQAPVQVSITTASVQEALVVPVTALLALAGGGYALEEVQPDGVHRLIPVALGLFDDEAGDVQVSGSEVAAGRRVVVPST
jgi:peptidoglycan hydrolase-like protein with peptidoglycan-binding domain